MPYDRPTSGATDRRLSVALYVLSLIGSLSTAAATLFVRAEVMETRVMILEKITEAGRDYVRRPEFDALAGRVGAVEQEQRHR